MMVVLLLKGEVQAILPKSYTDMLFAEDSYDFRIIDYYECDIECTLFAGDRNITFDEWYFIKNGVKQTDKFIPLF